MGGHDVICDGEEGAETREEEEARLTINDPNLNVLLLDLESGGDLSVRDLVGLA